MPDLAIRFEDVEAWFAAELRTRLRPENPSLWAGRVLPDTPRWPSITVQRQGGNPGRLDDNPRLGIRIFAETDAEANRLALDVLQVLSALALSGQIGPPVTSGPSETSSDFSGVCKRYISTQFRRRGIQT